MKRPHTEENHDSNSNSNSNSSSEDESNKKIKQQPEEQISKEAESVLLDENLLYEILRHVDDGRALATAACVSRQWRQTAHDERIWELICTKHNNRSPIQLRAVVSALGGFRRLYSSHLWPLLKPAPAPTAAPSTSAWPCVPIAAPAPARARLGRDEMNLSLSLLSIKYFEKMSFNNRSK